MPDKHQVGLKVMLLEASTSEEFERLPALAARLCYSPSDIESLTTNFTREQAIKLLDRVIAMGHGSVLEHVKMTFAVEGISRVTTHQLVRHRIASFSQQSQRYVTESDMYDFIMPESIEQAGMGERGREMHRLLHSFYADMIAAGVKAEDARYYLPNAAETKIIITMNARELLHFFSVRCCERAQWEIRAMAIEMLRLARLHAPRLFAKAGPGCVAGRCPEGSFCCGKTVDVRKRFKLLR